MTKIVNIHHGQGYDVYIGRPGKGQTSKWGNPFVIGQDGTREDVIEKFRAYLVQSYHDGKFTREDILALEGKTLDEKVAKTIEGWYLKTEHKRRPPITVFDDFWKK